VTGLSPRANDVLIETHLDRYCARRVILSAGAWLPEFLAPDTARAFRVFRQVMFWFAPEDDSFRPGHFPVFIWELSGRTQAIYGFPDIDGDGVKVATEQYDRTTTAEDIERDVSADEAAAIHENLIAPFLPQLPANCVRAASCLYTVTADFGFVIDRHPQSERVIIASCCSGHGFKHSAAVGEALAKFVSTGQSPIDLSPFRLSRFSQT
jgi:sarcosine oxidase